MAQRFGEFFGMIRDTLTKGELAPLALGLVLASLAHVFVETWAEAKLTAMGRANAPVEATVLTSAGIGIPALAAFLASEARATPMAWGYFGAGAALNELSEAVDLMRAFFVV